MKSLIILLTFFSSVCLAQINKIDSNSKTITLMGSGLGYSSSNIYFQLAANYEFHIKDKIGLGVGARYEGGNESFVAYGPQLYGEYNFSGYFDNSFIAGALFTYQYINYSDGAEAIFNALRVSPKEFDGFLITYGGYKWHFGSEDQIIFGLQLGWNILDNFQQTTLFLNFGYKF